MSLEASDWRRRYEAGDTPWDLGQAHPELRARLAEGWRPSVRGERALVPGCGRGHDALALAEAGWSVIAVDRFDPTGGELARRLRASGGEFREGDALELADPHPFELVFDHTFFCAIDPRARPRWGVAMARHLTLAGEIVALVFPLDKPASDGGPPFGMSAQDLAGALGPEFRIRADLPVEHRVARRSFGERWAVLARTR